MYIPAKSGCGVVLIELLAKLNGGSGISRVAGCLSFSVKALRLRANLDCESDVNGKTAIYATIPTEESNACPNMLTVYRGAYRK